MKPIATALLSISLLLQTPAQAGYAEEWMIGVLVAYQVACEEMSDTGKDDFAAYVLQFTGSVSNMQKSKAYQEAHNSFIEPITSEAWRQTVCSQFKKALIRKEFYYWLF